MSHQRQVISRSPFPAIRPAPQSRLARSRRQPAIQRQAPHQIVRSQIINNCRRPTMRSAMQRIRRSAMINGIRALHMHRMFRVHQWTKHVYGQYRIFFRQTRLKSFRKITIILFIIYREAKPSSAPQTNGKPKELAQKSSRSADHAADSRTSKSTASKSNQRRRQYSPSTIAQLNSTPIPANAFVALYPYKPMKSDELELKKGCKWAYSYQHFLMAANLFATRKSFSMNQTNLFPLFVF